MSGLHLLQIFFKACIQVPQKLIEGFLGLVLLGSILLSSHLQAAELDEMPYFHRISKDSLWHYGMNKPKLNLSFKLDHSTIPLIHSSEFQPDKPFPLPKAGVVGMSLGLKHFTPRLRFGEMGALEYCWVKFHSAKGMLGEDFKDYRCHHPELAAGSNKIPLNPCASPKKLFLGSVHVGASVTGIFLSQLPYVSHFALDGGILYGPWAQMIGKFKKSKKTASLEYSNSYFISDYQLYVNVISSFCELKGCRRWPTQDQKKNLLSQTCYSGEIMGWLPFFPAFAVGYSTWYQNPNEKGQLNFTEVQEFNNKFLGIYDGFCQSWWNGFVCVRLGPYLEIRVMYGQESWIKGGSKADKLGGKDLPACVSYSLAWNFRMSEVSARAFDFQRANSYQNFYARLLQPLTPMLLSSTNIIMAS